MGKLDEASFAAIVNVIDRAMTSYSSEVEAFLVFILSEKEIFAQWCNAKERKIGRKWVDYNGFDPNIDFSELLSIITITIV